MGRNSASFLTLVFFAACGGQSVYTEGGGASAGEGGNGGSGGRGGASGGTGGRGGASGGTGGRGGTSGGVGGATGGDGTGGFTTGGVGGSVGGVGGTGGVGTGGFVTGGVGGSVGGAGGVGTGGFVTGGSAGAVAGTGVGGVGIMCPPGLSQCRGQCVNLASDRENCGSCNADCSPGEICVNAECTLSCQSGLTECNGICVNTDSDRRNCGGCGNACASGEICINGACELSCQEGLVDCGGLCTDTSIDPRHCGACGAQCPASTHATGACVDSSCTLTCLPGYGNCDGGDSDGCEAVLASDPTNCGVCHATCGMNQTCQSGKCASVGTYHWKLVTTTACNAWCGQAPAPLNTCGGPWACNSASLAGYIWIYEGGPSPPPNPASQSAYGWVHWFCDDNGCGGPGPSAGSCNSDFNNSIYQCVFE